MSNDISVLHSGDAMGYNNVHINSGGEDQRSFYGSVPPSSNAGDDRDGCMSEELELRGEERGEESEGAEGESSDVRGRERLREEKESVGIGSVFETDEGRSETGETGTG